MDPNLTQTKNNSKRDQMPQCKVVKLPGGNKRMTLQDTGRERNFPNKVTLLAQEIATTIDNQDFIQFIVFCITMATIREKYSLENWVKTEHEKGG